MFGKLKLIKGKEITAKFGLSKSTLQRMAKSGEFPQNVQISKGRVAWIEEEVNAWFNAKCEARKANEAGVKNV